MTNRSQTSTRIRKIIADHLTNSFEKTTEDKHLVSDLGADSLDSVEIVMAVEEEFDIEISDAEAEGLQTVGHVVDMVERLIQPDTPAA